MDVNKPLVSIYIPTFNRLELLKRAVESVRNQSYSNLEILIVDDCSTDGTQEYLSQISKTDTRIRYFFKQKNSGACVSRNIAINNAKGIFITGLDDDDYFLPQRIERFVNNWKDSDTNVVFLYSSNITKMKEGVRQLSKFKLFFLKKIITSKDLRIANYPGNQIFTKTKTIKQIGGFDRDMPAWQDMETWYRLLKETNGVGKYLANPTYVCDISHDHERITNLDKHILARKAFIEKHKLNKKERKLYFKIEAHKLSKRILIARYIHSFALIDLYYILKNLFKKS